MSKRSEETALKAYPPTYSRRKRYAKRVQSERIDTHQAVRLLFQKGYEQAEKDLALTWEDMEKISDLLVSCYFLWFRPKKDIMEQSFYEEVLRRFNEYKSKKNESK